MSGNARYQNGVGDRVRSGGDEQFWHTLSEQELIGRLQTDGGRGLDSTEAERRLLVQGPNEIEESPGRSVSLILLEQFSDFMILVLLAAAITSGVVGEPLDAMAILVIVFLNAVIGAVQEFRAERAIAALRLLGAPVARVIRDGLVTNIPARELVAGDLLQLEAGDLIPADVRLLEGVDLQMDEAALTGESQAVEKQIETLSDRTLQLGDRSNMAWRGTQVTRGRGHGVVVATGMASEIGRIARLLKTEKSVKTPLQKRLARFGRQLGLAVLAICALIFVTGLLQGQPVLLMFLTAISLAVAAIPEALPAVVSISLAIGARKMSHHKALVRRLPAVETLGSVTYICSDKTGTLTENRMTLEQLVIDGRRMSVEQMTRSEGPLRSRVGEALALCNNVSGPGTSPVGDPTEVALFAAAESMGFSRETLVREYPRLAEVPFDSVRKCMTTLHRGRSGTVIYLKGAPEVVVGRCSTQWTSTGPAPLDGRAVLGEAQALAAEGYRVLALAFLELTERPEGSAGVMIPEQGLNFLALAALIDPPRPEAEQSVAECRSAGITPVMITGDHPGTAQAIAVRLGIADDGARVMTGRELEEITDAELAERVKEIQVYARVNPEQKIRIVRALQSRGEFVAMTGDGINDAPALKRAGIGVAMGRKGTAVAREAADMVLLDDNFATIVNAVREGRRIFDNIRKFVKYTMTSNAGEIWTLFLAPFLGLPIPLLPIHILWINLVTDGLPGLALTAEPDERGIMRRPPRPPDENIFAHGMWQHMIWVGLLIGGLSILGQAWAYRAGSGNWQTVVFTVLTLSQLFQVLGIRSERASLFQVGILSNLPLLGAVLLTVALQLAVIYLPFLNIVFKTQPLSMTELLVCFGLASLVFVAVEAEKLLARAGLIYGAAGGRKQGSKKG